MSLRRPMCLICLVFLFLLYVFKGGKPKPSWPVDKLCGRTVTVTGTVADRQIKNDVYNAYLKNVSLDSDTFPYSSAGIVVKLSDIESAKKHVRIGARLEARGVFEPFEQARCEGQFDQRDYYMIRGYEGRLVRARITGVSLNYGYLTETLRRVREKAYDILTDNMEPEDAGVVAAMTLGDKTGLDTEVKELYQNAGISHVLALSGLHIASVGLAILKVLKKTGLPNAVSYITSFSLIAVYAAMTGMSTSTVRALIMFSLFILSRLIGRTYDILSAAAVSAMLILLEDPEYVYDTGFMLSFGAILGIACIYPVLERIPEAFCDPDKYRGRKKSKVYQSLCIGLSVMTATFPVMADSFMQISVCSLLINVIVVPLMAVVLFTGFAGIVIGFTGADPGFILKITHYILSFYTLIGEASEKIDGNILVIGKPGKWQKITYAVIAAIVVIAGNIEFRKKRGGRYVLDRAGRHNYLKNDRYVKMSNDKITYSIESASQGVVRKRKKMTVALITPVMIVCSCALLMLHPREDIEIRNVDVGQGDCSLVWGRSIPTVMIDGGSSDVSRVGKYRIVPVLKANRVTTIDICVLSHMDSDHVNGVTEMLEDESCPIRIKKIVISQAVADSDTGSENYERLIAAAKARDTEVTTIAAGDRIICENVSFHCLSPREYTDENESSIVLKMEYFGDDGKDQFTALFTGDIGEDTERSISSAVGDIYYLKVAHHGSRNSSCDDFLRKVTPEVSVISDGMDNSYGHPHKETLERLKKTGTSIYRTDEQGEIIVTADDGLVKVQSILGP